MSETAMGLVTMTAEECSSLLLTHRPRLGRLAFVDDGWPLVLPLNYLPRGAAIYFRSAPGSKVDAAIQTTKVAFQVDHVDVAWEEGWSVLAFGHLAVVDDPDELAAIRQLPLRPWAGGDRPHVLRLDVATMTGRRIV